MDSEDNAVHVRPGFKKVDVAGVKLTCVPINTSGSLLGNQEIIDKTVLADGVDIKCNASKYHKLVSLSGLGECGLQGDKNKVGSKLYAPRKVFSTAALSFKMNTNGQRSSLDEIY